MRPESRIEWGVPRITGDYARLTDPSGDKSARLFILIIAAEIVYRTLPMYNDLVT